MPPRRCTAPPRPSRFVGLPTELLTMIASYLTLVELAQALVLYRDWHALLTATPFLWQLVHIDFEEYREFPVVRFLGYSLGLPLSLRLRNIGPRQIGDVMPAVGANLYRTRILKLWYDGCFDDETDGYGEDHDARSDYRDRIFSPLLSPAPILAYFAIGCTGVMGDRLEIPLGDVFGGHAPLLTHLTSDNDFEVDMPPDMRQNLVSATDYNHKTVPEMMDCYPNLKVLRFCGEWAAFHGDVDPGLEPSDAAFWGQVPSVGWAVFGVDIVAPLEAAVTDSFCTAIHH